MMIDNEKNGFLQNPLDSIGNIVIHSFLDKHFLADRKKRRPVETGEELSSPRSLRAFFIF